MDKSINTQSTEERNKLIKAANILTLFTVLAKNENDENTFRKAVNAVKDMVK